MCRPELLKINLEPLPVLMPEIIPVRPRPLLVSAILVLVASIRIQVLAKGCTALRDVPEALAVIALAAPAVHLSAQT